MSLFMISFEFNSSKEDYSSFFETIEQSWNYWGCMRNTWIISSDQSASEISEILSQHIVEGEDIVLVIKLEHEQRDAYWNGISPECGDWLASNL